MTGLSDVYFFLKLHSRSSLFVDLQILLIPFRFVHKDNISFPKWGISSESAETPVQPSANVVTMLVIDW